MNNINRRQVWVLLLLCCVAALVGCPGPAPKPPTTQPTQNRHESAAAFSLSKLLPAAPSYFLLGKSITTLLETTREGMEPLRVIDRQLTVDRADDELRKETGFSFINIKDLDEAGVDIEGEVAFFSDGISPTIIIQVADRKALETWLASKTKKMTKYVKRYRGQTVTSWGVGSKGRGSYVVLDDKLIIHFAMRKGRDWKPDLRWLDLLMERSAKAGGASRSSTLAGSELMTWLLAQAGPRHRDVVVFVDPSRLNEASLKVEPRRSSAKGCDALDKDLAELQRLAVAGRLARRSASFKVLARLGSSARAEVAAAASEQPIGLPSGLWRAPARIMVNLKPSYLSERLTRFGVRGCGLVYELLREARSELRKLVQNDWLVRSEGRLALALLMADERGQNTLHLRGALVAGASAKGAAEYYRSQVAVESGKDAKIGGHQVQLVRPMLTIADEVWLSVADGLLHLTAGDGVMKQVLAHVERPAPDDQPRTLFDARIAPERIADVRASLKLFEAGQPASGPTKLLGLYKYGRRRSGSDLDVLGHLISSYKLLHMKLQLAGGGVKSELHYELR